MKPICVPCERFMRVKKAGYVFTECMPTATTGPRERGVGAAGWAPYKIWSGDLYHCPTCGTETIVGIGLQPISEHYMSDFATVTLAHGADRLLVKDC